MMRQGFLSIAGILVVGLLVLMLLNELDHVRVKPDTDSSNAPDIILTGANLSTYDEAGNLQYRVTASHIEHLERAGATLLDEPRLELHTSRETWQVSAGSGKADQDNRSLLLEGNVEARLDGPSAVVLKTARLLYHVREQRLELPEAVDISHPGGRTRAGALNADIAAGKLNMQQGVETRYAVDL